MRLDRFEAFSFNDITQPRDGLTVPSFEDVARIIGCVRACRTDALIMQCWFGVSRSTAAALIAARVWSSADAATRLRAIAPWATPNALMIAHADALLGCGGEFSRSVASIGRGDGVGRAVRFAPEG